MTAPEQQKKPAPLPRLREDLQIIPGKRSLDGEQQWRVYDPVQHRFLEIDDMTFKMVSLWQQAPDAAGLAALLDQTFGLKVDVAEIGRLAEFVYANHLSQTPPNGDWKVLAREAAKSHESPWQWLLHNYLFFKIPLFRPQPFLTATLPVVEPLFRRSVHGAIALMGLIGLYLASREWDQFVNTFQHFFTVEGAALFACALFGVKALHELGHAYAAARSGCQVPAIGVAFMMMTPMFYTDVTDAWRLKSRRARMTIDLAGVAVELMIACVALLAWSFLPPGPARSLSFVLATSSLFMSLVVNLSPFMRFDGYFILSDLVGMPNLQPRAFAVTRWHLRKILFGLEDACPEKASRLKIAALVAYSWATWIYRLGLYFGIALVVYHYFFKLLGIILFAVEIGVFIVLPVYKEVSGWSKLGPRLGSPKRLAVTGCAFACLLLLAVMPWSTRVNIPVVIEPGELARVFPTRHGVIASIGVHQNDWVEAGTVLVTMTSDELDRDIAAAELAVQKVRAQLARLTADDADRENRVVLVGELGTAEQKSKGLSKQRDELEIRAPIAGRIVEFNSAVQVGKPSSARDLIAVLSSDAGYVARGFIGEHDIWRVSRGTPGRVVPDMAGRDMLNVTVEEISPTGAAVIDIPDLASVYGGKIAVQQDAQRRLVPVEARFAVNMTLRDPPKRLDVRYRGVAQLEGSAESFAAALVRQVYRVLIREAGA